MHWLQDNAAWLAPACYALLSEIICHSPLKSNSMMQLLMAGIKGMLPKKAE